MYQAFFIPLTMPDARRYPAALPLTIREEHDRMTLSSLEADDYQNVEGLCIGW